MSGARPDIVGRISESVINTLGLAIEPNTPVYMGTSNIEHMITRHPSAYREYGEHIPDILNFPDYVGINPGDDSIEYVKEFPLNNDFVKVAVRVSRRGTFFARSLYVLNTSRVRNFIANGTLRLLTNQRE